MSNTTFSMPLITVLPPYQLSFRASRRMLRQRRAENILDIPLQSDFRIAGEKYKNSDYHDTKKP